MSVASLPPTHRRLFEDIHVNQCYFPGSSPYLLLPAGASVRSGHQLQLLFSWPDKQDFPLGFPRGSQRMYLCLENDDKQMTAGNK